MDQSNGCEEFTYKPIGYLKSIFQTKNGTPRQSGLSKFARASLTISKNVFTNPEHSLQDLSEFSHIWLLWVFHQNQETLKSVKAKVAPPRLGDRVGVFSTRSPHRPANIGLTLVKLESVKGDTVFISGVDMVHGTPVLDIKPYLPMYDNPDIKSANENNIKTNEFNSELLAKEESETGKQIADVPLVKVPQWIGNPEDNLIVIFSSRAEAQILDIDLNRLEWLKSHTELRRAISDILSTDPRSVYRKTKCSDRMYFTNLDNVHVTAWYDPDIDGMEVIKVKLEALE